MDEELRGCEREFQITKSPAALDRLLSVLERLGRMDELLLLGRAARPDHRDAIARLEQRDLEWWYDWDRTGELVLDNYVWPLRGDDPEWIETAIQFVELAPRFHGSGYRQEKTLRGLRRDPQSLGPDQRERLRRVILRAVISGGIREFEETSRMARLVVTPGLLQTLQSLAQRFPDPLEERRVEEEAQRARRGRHHPASPEGDEDYLIRRAFLTDLSEGRIPRPTLGDLGLDASKLPQRTTSVELVPKEEVGRRARRTLGLARAVVRGRQTPRDRRG